MHTQATTYGADDGIRTRDPHLGKVAGLDPATCNDTRIGSSTCGYACSVLLNVFRRYSVRRGTSAGRA